MWTKSDQHCLWYDRGHIYIRSQLGYNLLSGGNDKIFVFVGGYCIRFHMYILYSHAYFKRASHGIWKVSQACGSLIEINGTINLVARMLIPQRDQFSMIRWKIRPAFRFLLLVKAYHFVIMLWTSVLFNLFFLANIKHFVKAYTFIYIVCVYSTINHHKKYTYTLIFQSTICPERKYPPMQLACIKSAVKDRRCTG